MAVLSPIVSARRASRRVRPLRALTAAPALVVAEAVSLVVGVVGRSAAVAVVQGALSTVTR